MVKSAAEVNTLHDELKKMLMRVSIYFLTLRWNNFLNPFIVDGNDEMILHHEYYGVPSSMRQGINNSFTHNILASALYIRATWITDLITNIFAMAWLSY